MKKITTILAVLFFGMFVAAGSAMAVGFSFKGDYKITDENSNNFAETITIVGKNYLSQFTDWDDVLDDGSYVYFDYSIAGFSGFTLSEDPDDYKIGDYYLFNPQTYSKVFNVKDRNDNLLMYGDLTLEKLIIDSSTGRVNPSLKINLTNIEVVVAGSDILDAFSNTEGAVNLTLNLEKDFEQAIHYPPEEGFDSGTFSGSATAVPEPTTMLLLGTSLLGLVAVGRRKIFKK